MGQCHIDCCRSLKVSVKVKVSNMKSFQGLGIGRLSASLVVLVSCLISLNNGYMIGHNPHYRTEMLDPQGRYQLEWMVDFDAKRITFNVTVHTIHWVGFGLSKDGQMAGADLVIGGVTTNGRAYFSDRHSVGTKLPEVDSRQDWTLHEAWETATQTFLSFSRVFDTCDPEDYPITADKVSIIWAYGESDTEILSDSGFHHQHRGSYDVYLLDPDYSPKIIRDPLQGQPKVIGRESSELKLWTISKRIELPQDSTSYLCTIHKGPRLQQKHHLVGFDVQFSSAESQKHVKSLLIYRCNAPRGSHSRSMFEPYLKSGGQSCFIPQRPEGDMPTDYCTELIHEWTDGGTTYFTPNNVGYPFGISQDEYYMVQAHYNNPNRAKDIFAEFELEFYYTNKIRENEAGIMVVGHEVPGLTPSLLIPPASSSHMIFGHCGTECTKLMLPSTGIKIYATNLHSHGTGRKLKLQHFRNNRELPWVTSDDNFNPSYQQIRILRDHVRVIPGDHLIMRCVYDTTKRNGTVVGGFSSSQETCIAYIHYYNKISEFTSCKSEIFSEDYRRRFLGVTNVTWDGTRQEYVVDDQEPREGLTVSEVSDSHVLWEPEMEAEFQRFHRYHPQINKCFREMYAREEPAEINDSFGTSMPARTGLNSKEDEYSPATAYPFGAKEYQPEQSCSLVNAI